MSTFRFCTPVALTVSSTRLIRLVPALTLVCGLAALSIWWTSSWDGAAKLRIPGTDRGPSTGSVSSLNPAAHGKLMKGVAGDTPLSTFNSLGSQLATSSWPGFRGPDRRGIASDAAGLLRTWGPTGPREIWSVDLGEGYAGAAIQNGCVYVMDYDHENHQSMLRCLSFEDGKELWRYAYPLSIKRNHGMTRTVPAVTSKCVVAMDSKCNLFCLDSTTGELRWAINLVNEFGATVPPWYTGQCPLIDGDRVIIAPGGRDALLAALDLESGKAIWKTPNPHEWKMTHSSIVTLATSAPKTYLYCASGGVVGVSAADGKLAWESTDWKISLATVPSPLVLDDGKVFLAGGYNAGCAMLQIAQRDSEKTAQTVFKRGPEIFGATQHTPILYRGNIYGTRADGQFVCLSPEGKVIWTSGNRTGNSFGLGSFLIADDLIYALNDSGKLSLIEASTSRFNLLAQAQILHGRESWAPMAIAGGRLLARDLTRMVCLDIGSPSRTP